MLSADLAGAQGQRLAQAELERLLRARGEREAAFLAPAAAAQSTGPERALDAFAHGIDVDPERGEHGGIDVVLAAADDPYDVVADARGVDAEAGEEPRA